MADKKKEKGMVLMLVVMFTVMLTMLGSAYFFISHREAILALKMERIKVSFYAAEGGVERAKAWLADYKGSIETDYGLTALDPFGGWQIVSGGEAKFKAHIDPDDDNWGKVSKTYIIVSSGSPVCPAGSVGSSMTKPVIEQVIRLNLDRYAFVSDKEWDDADGATGNNGNQRNYFCYLDEFNGRVHSNDQVSILGGTGGIYGDPMFSTSSAIPLVYQISTSEDIWYWSDGLRSGGGTGGGQDLPLNDTDIYPVLNNEIMIFDGFNMGELQSMAGCTIDGDKVIYIRDNSIQYDVANVVIPVGGLLVWVDGNPTILSNPAFEFTGDLTIACSGGMTISGNIICAPDPNKGIIGLVATGNIVIDVPSPEAYGDVKIDAFLKTPNKIESPAWSNAAVPPSRVIVFGAMVQGVRGELGVLLPDTYGVTQYRSGYAIKSTYDSRVIETPPHDYPTSGFITTVWWKEKPTQ
ncbi:MAG: pilus assembly PilX N-terminal domain-containing protein [Elusimicrobiota bacterium]